MIEKMFPQAYLLMPNLAEAASLAGFPVTDLESMERAAKYLRTLGPRNLLIKGGHLAGDAADLLVTEDGQVEWFSATRVESQQTHGTGCTYSAAITAELAKGSGLIEAIRISKAFITNAIQTAPQLGKGSGPLNHFA
jgi:hydroxymethylpyrimidine kinase/phosphomethylpyrimidine kinase